MKLLVVEDDAETAAYVVNGLHEHGHLVDHASDGRDGLFLVAENAYDVMIVDRMLPGLDGLSMVRAARAAGARRRPCSSPPWAASTTGSRVWMPAATIIW